MFERNDDVLFVCYDNEAYMNTGVQRSGATPAAARTATTQVVGDQPGNPFGQGKDMPRIAMAHEIPYVATATIADLHDLEAKVERAMELRGARYLHVLVTARSAGAARRTTRSGIARLAVESGVFPVFEAEAGEVTRVSRSGARCRSRTTCARSGASPTCSSPSSDATSSTASRRRPTATSPATGCSTRRGVA